MSWVMMALNTELDTNEISVYETKLVKLSSEKVYFHSVQSNKLSDISAKYDTENELVEAKFEGELKNLDASSEEYLETKQEELKEKQKLSNEQADETQKVQEETSKKEGEFDMLQESYQTRLEVLREDRRSAKETRDKCISEECSYFSSSGGQ